MKSFAVRTLPRVAQRALHFALNFRMKPFITTLIFLPALCNCAKKEVLPSVDQKVIGPIDVASDSSGSYFYVLNTDFDRSYKSGSILVVNNEGKKIVSVEVPRLGRSLNLAGNDLIATFDNEDEESPREIHLYDISDREAPRLVKRWNSDDHPGLQLDQCTPVNSELKAGYQHFFVSCREGRLYAGTFKEPREDSELTLVRDYETTRRALYLDPIREVLLAFPTDMYAQKTVDRLEDDIKSFDPDTGHETDEANEIPDVLENTRYRRRNSHGERRKYRFVVYNIAEERQKEFPFQPLVDADGNDLAAKEERWLYFTLRNFGQTPDTDAEVTNESQKHYRTNFWKAQADPFDTNTFYLSHRGKRSKNNKYANSVVRVSVIGDLTQNDPVPLTSNLLRFERIYGYKGELDEERHFPGDFQVALVNGRKTLVVNHFKDRVTFGQEANFSIAAKVLDGGLWRDEVHSSSPSSSFYQFSVNAQGKALSCSFYGNSLIPLEVNPGVDITVGWDNLEKID